MTLWSGRFSTGMGSDLWDLSESYSFDHVLYPTTSSESKAHVRGLVRAGTAQRRGGDHAARPRSTSSWRVRPQERFERAASDEDIHMAIERRVIELAGDVGAKLHTARSRNDQVATTFRLFVTAAVAEVAVAALGLIDVLVEVGDRHADAYLPGLHPSAAGPTGAAQPPPQRPRVLAPARRRPTARRARPHERLSARRRCARRDLPRRSIRR